MSQIDTELQQAVSHELDWDTRLNNTEIAVAVHAGVVTLDGTVESWAERIAAQKAAHRVHGVLDVANELRVKLPGSGVRTDTEIAHSVRHALPAALFVRRRSSRLPRQTTHLFDARVQYRADRFAIGFDAELP